MFEAWYIYALLGLVLLLAIARPTIKRILGAKAAKLGREAGLSLEDRVNNSKWANAGKERLATSLEFSGGGLSFVASALDEQKGVTRVGEDRWHLKFADADDVLLGWQATEAPGGVLRVLSAKEMLSDPVGDRQWMKVAGAVEAAAASQGITVNRRIGALERQLKATAPTPFGFPRQSRQTRRISGCGRQAN